MRKLFLLITAVALWVVAPRAFAQTPLIEAGGVQNTASKLSLTSIAPQVLVTIKGQNLATSTAQAQTFPATHYAGRRHGNVHRRCRTVARALVLRIPHADRCPSAQRDSRHQHSRHHAGGFQRALQNPRDYWNLSLSDWSPRRLFAGHFGLRPGRGLQCSPGWQRHPEHAAEQPPSRKGCGLDLLPDGPG
jgi:hypothetical protein